MPAHHFRRPRNKEQRYKLVSSILNNYNRFFPRGCPELFYNEIDEQVRVGRTKLRVPKRVRPDYGPVLGNEESDPGKVITTCPACLRKMWQFASIKQLRIYCGDRCRQSARLSAMMTAFPEWEHFRPVTTELRMFCYTHDVPGRQTAMQTANVITNEADIMKTDLNTYYENAVRPTAEHQEALRARVQAIMGSQLQRARAQLAGTTKGKKWDQNQVRLFLGLLNKVLPDMTANLSIKLSEHHNHDHKDPRDMSIEELEAQLAAVQPQKYRVNPVGHDEDVIDVPETEEKSPK